MEPASAEKLIKAFQLLDVDSKGVLSKEYIGKLMSEEGEPFTQVIHLQNQSLLSSWYVILYLHFFFGLLKDELEEMMAAAVDVQSGEIHYEYYINSLMVKKPMIQLFCFHFI